MQLTCLNSCITCIKSFLGEPKQGVILVYPLSQGLKGPDFESQSGEHYSIACVKVKHLTGTGPVTISREEMGIIRLKIGWFNSSQLGTC